MKLVGQIEEELKTLEMWKEELDMDTPLPFEEDTERSMNFDEITGAISALQWVLGYRSDIFN